MNVHINQIISERRSVYLSQFAEGRVVDDAIVWQMLENANWAPTHKKTEPWRFVVFCGEGLEKFAQFQANLYKEKNTGEKFGEATFQKLLSNPLKASHIIAIAVKRHEQVREIEEISAVACAVQNMYLTAHAYDIGVYWGTGGVTYYPEAKSFFGLEEQDILLGFLYVGHIERHSPAGTRQPIQEKVTWYS